MILADTPIWIAHLRTPGWVLAPLLDQGRILAHPFIRGELAVGQIRDRDAVLRTLRQLPQAIVASDDEVMKLISVRKLYGLGAGYIDLHLLASVLLTPDACLWTMDRRLAQIAESLGVGFYPAQ